ncbi:MAG: hypothetical protein QOH60_3382 [Mycobacterium sp.]|nr:hypothetical protein [Mycobacterium sp.]
MYDTVLRELRAGFKQSHWMWFIFPQLKALGRSSTAVYFGISALAEAQAYLAHALLGPRLRECARIVTGIDGLSVNDIFGSPDDLKLRSSMTLFAHAATDDADFVGVLDKFYSGEQDPATLSLLAQRPQN